MRVQVVNNCQGPHYIQGQPVDKGGPKKAAGPLLIIRPGLNLIDGKDLAERRKLNEAFNNLFKTTIKPSKSETADPRKFGKPMLEVVGKSLSDKDPFKTDDGKELSLEEAQGLIDMTEDTDLLGAWLKAQKPGTEITKAINTRLKQIASGVAA
jgi:hypothetical protein